MTSDKIQQARKAVMSIQREFTKLFHAVDNPEQVRCSLFEIDLSLAYLKELVTEEQSAPQLELQQEEKK